MSNIKELEKLLKLGVINQETFNELKNKKPEVKRTHVDAPNRMNKVLKDNFNIDLPSDNKKPLNEEKWNYEPAKELVKEEKKVDKDDKSLEGPTELEELLFNLKNHKEENESEEINEGEVIEVDEPISEDELPTVEQIEEEISNEDIDYLHEETEEIIVDPEETTLPNDDIESFDLEEEEEEIENSIPEEEVNNDIPEEEVNNDIPEEEVNNDIPEEEVNNDIPEEEVNNDIPEEEVNNDILEEEVNNDILEEEEEIKPVNPPRGWHLRKEFIDEVGNIFHKGQYVGRDLNDEDED